MSGILGALAGAADSASGILGQKIKEDADARMRNQQASIEERLQAAKEARTEQAQIRMKQWDQGQATARAGRIESRAQGILGQSAEPVMSIEGDSGDMVAKGAIPKDHSEADKWRARSEAALLEGDLPFAAASRGVLDAERRFSADEARVKTDAKRLEQNDRKMDETERYNREREVRLDSLAQAQAGRADAMSERTYKLGIMTATKEALKGANENLKRLDDAAKIELNPVKREAIQTVIIAAEKEAARYRSALASEGIQPPEGVSGNGPKQPFNPTNYSTAPKSSAAAPAPAAPQAQRPTAQTATAPRSTGQQTFGILSSEKMAREEAAAGNPKAIEYLRKLEKAKAEEEERANTEPFYGRGY